MDYSNNNILFENDKYLAVESPSMEDGLKIGPEFLTTTRHGKNVYNNRTVYFFINKEEKETRYGIITLTIKGDYFELYDNYGPEIQLNDLFHYFPTLDKIVTDIVGNVDLITTLILIENGKEFKNWELNEMYKKWADDNSVKLRIQYNKRYPANSKIYLSFDYTEGILKHMGFGDNDLTYIEGVLSRYGNSGYLFADYMDMDNEWNEGYILHYYFDEENKQKIDEIVSIIKPEFYNWKENDDIRRQLCEFLNKSFDRQIEDVISEYSGYYERAGIDALKKELYADFCDPFNKFHIFVTKYSDDTKKCFDEYRTWVLNLKDLLIKNNVSTVQDLIKELAEKSVGNSLRHEAYEYGSYGEFDNDGFNSSISSYLDKILDEVTENPQKYSINPSETGKLILILKKYGLNKDNKLENDRGSFTITGIKNGRLLLTHTKKDKTTENKSFSAEEFNNFLSMDELFEHLIRRLKKLL